MVVRGIRGAITVPKNDAAEISAATKELLTAMIKENDIDPSQIVSAFFTVTKDLNADFPASSARDLGWTMVPLICATEIDVPGSMSRVIRVMLQLNTDKSQAEINHVYLRDAVGLRKDLAAQ